MFCRWVWYDLPRDLSNLTSCKSRITENTSYLDPDLYIFYIPYNSIFWLRIKYKKEIFVQKNVKVKVLIKPENLILIKLSNIM